MTGATPLLLAPGCAEMTPSEHQVEILAATPPRPAGLAGPLSQPLARLVLFVFLLTFIVARVVVYLIMARRVPDLYVHVGRGGGTHLHHLNYGIFLLSAVGAALVFLQPRGPVLRACAVVYAVGLALTFDEFGMWLHLGGPYWQRASFDAVVVIAALLGLIASAPTLRRFGPRQWLAAAVVAAGVCAFGITWRDSLRHSEQRLILRLEVIENAGPP